jgi:hypothetical protein
MSDGSRQGDDVFVAPHDDHNLMTLCLNISMLYMRYIQPTVLVCVSCSKEDYTCELG